MESTTRVFGRWRRRRCCASAARSRLRDRAKIAWNKCEVLLGTWPQIYTVLNFGMTIFNFHFLLLFLANLTSNWVIFDEKMERQA